MRLVNREVYAAALREEASMEELETERKSMVLSLDRNGNIIALAVYDKGGEVRYWASSRVL